MCKKRIIFNFSVPTAQNSMGALAKNNSDQYSQQDNRSQRKHRAEQNGKEISRGNAHTHTAGQDCLVWCSVRFCSTDFKAIRDHWPKRMQILPWGKYTIIYKGHADSHKPPSHWPHAWSGDICASTAFLGHWIEFCSLLHCSNSEQFYCFQQNYSKLTPV